MAASPSKGISVLQRLLDGFLAFAAGALAALFAWARGFRGTIVALAVVAFAGFLLYRHPPIQSVDRGEVGFRTNLLTGDVSEWKDGSVLVLPGLHRTRVLSLRDSTYRPLQSARADGEAPLQSLEGLSLGVDLSVRYAIDPARARSVAATLPDDVAREIVEPAVQGIIYKTFARYTVREIFSTKRVEIQQAIETELRARLAADGVALRGVLIGKIDLPADYRRGMHELLAEELASEKMRYTLDLKEKRVKETALEGEAQKVRSEKAAEAQARVQIIAARAQEEAMKHVLPLKERQIEQRKLEADADKAARIRQAEATAEARRIEARGEAAARSILAEAEAYRLEQIGKAHTEQMVREGAVMTKHPLLIQKVLADKLSDKVQVIIAPPSSDGSLVGAVLGGHKQR
jgi:regulator of protease activity HflC (stomatin/prohibitin superfamily)